MSDHINNRELRVDLHGPTLLYAGRISKDKNLDFLRELYQRILSRYPHTNLVIAGDGPYLAELKESFKGSQRVHHSGCTFAGW